MTHDITTTTIHLVGKYSLVLLLHKQFAYSRRALPVSAYTLDQISVVRRQSNSGQNPCLNWWNKCQDKITISAWKSVNYSRLTELLNRTTRKIRFLLSPHYHYQLKITVWLNHLRDYIFFLFSSAVWPEHEKLTLLFEKSAILAWHLFHQYKQVFRLEKFRNEYESPKVCLSPTGWKLLH